MNEPAGAESASHFASTLRGLGAVFVAPGLVTASLVVTSLAPSGAAAELPDPLAAGWQDDAVCELLSEDDRHRALLCNFPPGVGHERHFHAPHFGYTVAGGRMQMRDAEGVREVDLATGLSWASDGVDWHEVLNVGDTTAVFLIVEPRTAEMSGGWRLAYRHDENGQPVEGSKAELIAAIRAGKPVRVYSRGTRVEHSAEVLFTTIFEGEVFGQIEEIHGQQPGIDPPTIDFREPGRYWRAVYATTGRVVALMDGNEASERWSALSWFVDDSRSD